MDVPLNDDEVSSLEMLADYECPECGPMAEVIDDLFVTEDEATAIIAGDGGGIMRCPNDWCGAELELSAGAALDMLAMVAERLPELAPKIADTLAAD